MEIGFRVSIRCVVRFDLQRGRGDLRRKRGVIVRNRQPRRQAKPSRRGLTGFSGSGLQPTGYSQRIRKAIRDRRSGSLQTEKFGWNAAS